MNSGIKISSSSGGQVQGTTTRSFFFLKNNFHKYYKQSSFFVISNIENTGCKDVNHFSPEQPIYKKYKQEVLLV